MKVTKELLENQEVTLSIQAEEGDLTPYYDRAYRRLVQRINVPGFRKGKAPRSIVQRLVGEEAMLEEAIEFFIPVAVEDAVKAEGIEQGGVPRVEVTQREPSVVLKATVPLLPKVTLNAYREIHIPADPVQVTEEEADKMLEDVRYTSAPWGPVERPVALDDQVTMDARGEVDGKVVTDQNAVVFYLTEGSIIPVNGFAEALVGATVGEPREFTLSVPEDYRDPALAGKACTFHVTVKEVKAKLLPDLDDEFAKGVGAGYESLEALKKSLRDRLLQRKEQEARQRHEESVVQELVGRATVEVSPMLVEHEAIHILEEEQQTLKRQRVTVDQYLSAVGRTEEQHREEAKKAALDRITRVYALNKVAELEGIQATEEEIDEEISDLVSDAGNREKAMRRELGTPSARSSLSSILNRRKAIQRLVAIATGETVGSSALAPETPAQESSPGGTGNAGNS
ncbi:MAG: trigger factor [Chloroflexi bacterium]|nr:trigger factor [Chloroflexota bacterium]